MTSPLTANTILHKMVRYDARQEILNSIGDALDKTRVLGNQIILAPYIPSGIIWSEYLGFPIDERLSLERLFELYDDLKEGRKRGFIEQQSAKECIHQGKVHLVIKAGEQATLDLRTGDWVMTLQECTRGISLTSADAKKSRVLEQVGVEYAAGWPCKIATDSDLYMVLPHQDLVV